MHFPIARRAVGPQNVTARPAARILCPARTGKMKSKDEAQNVADTQEDPPTARPESSAEGAGVRADINLGHACNNRCLFCMQGLSEAEQRQWLPLEKWREEIDHYAGDFGLKSLGILGGEPTLYPWLTDALDYAAGKGFNDVTINTNGYRLADPEFGRTLLRKGVNRVCISIHSHIKEIEDKLSGRDGSLETKIAALKNLARLKEEGEPAASVSINAVLNRLNLRGLDAFIEFFMDLGVRDVRFNFIRPEGRAGLPESIRELVPRFTEAVPHLVALARENEKKWRIKLSFGEIPYCIYPRSLFANPSFRARYVGEYRDRRTHVSSFRNPGGDRKEDMGRQRFIWQNLKIDVLKRFASSCRECAWADVCGGVWIRYLETYGEDEFHPAEP